MSYEADDLDELLATLRKYDVAVYKNGELLIQMNPKLPDFTEPEVSNDVMAGGWKRQKDLE